VLSSKPSKEDLLAYLHNFNFEEATKEILRFIKSTTEKANSEGVVVGLSGGVDSSLTATLCVKALGNARVLGIIMPLEFTPKKDIKDASELAEQLGIKTEYVDIQGISEAFFRSLKINTDSETQRIPAANIRARIRMIILYYYANMKNLLVAGTSDKSEVLLGFFTKYGDGGVDFEPISHLYKTQVRLLSEYLGLPRRIAYKPSSPQLYPGHKATDELPLDYEALDPLLVALFDYKMSTEEASKVTGLPIEIARETMRRFNASDHKRRLPPALEEWPVKP